MIIGKYIKQLLDERKRVLLPGFGNLEVKETGGGVPTSGNRIDPPGLLIRFDTGYSKDDGLLASVFAAGEEFDEVEAGQRILELVDAIKFALDKGESYEIPEAGTFSRADDGKIHFKVDPQWVLEPDQYGLESMDLLELEELPSKEPLKKAVRSEQEQAPPAKKVIKTSTPLTELHPPEKNTPRFNKWRVIWIVAGVLAVILVALIFIPVDTIRKPKPMDPTVTGSPGTEVPAREESATPALDSDDRTGEATTTDEPDPVEVEHNFFIIAGSFKHLKNASDLQDQLKAKGYPAEVMITENRMYRVSVSSYATKELAERSLAGMKATPGLKSCWLLSN